MKSYVDRRVIALSPAAILTVWIASAAILRMLIDKWQGHPILWSLSHPWNWLKLDANASATQALMAVIGVVGLAVYCSETYKLRRTAEVQKEASTQPFPVLHQLKFSGSGGLVFCIRNHGLGPIADSYLKLQSAQSPEDNPKSWEQIGSVGIQEETVLGHHQIVGHTMVNYQPFKYCFCDLAGNWYWMVGGIRGGKSYTHHGRYELGKVPKFPDEAL